MKMGQHESDGRASLETVACLAHELAPRVKTPAWKHLETQSRDSARLSARD